MLSFPKHTQSRGLRQVVRSNGLFSTVAGLLTAGLSSWLASWMEVPRGIVIIVGVGTLLFGLALISATRTAELSRAGVALTMLADFGWVFSALALIVIPGSMTVPGKVLLAAVSAVVGVFAVLQYRGLAQDTLVRPAEVFTEKLIDAPIDRVWEVLTDLGEYEAWNPFVVEAAGELDEGNKMNVKTKLPTGKTFSFSPTVTRVEPGRSFEWLGNTLAPGVFDGRHVFRLETDGDQTKLIQSEQFSGVLVPFTYKVLDLTAQGFEASNEALAGRVGG